MASRQHYRPFRIMVDLWVARIGSVAAWVWFVFWALMGVTGLGMWVFGEAADATEKLLPFFFLGLAALHWLVIRACRRTKDLELDFHLYCAIFAREPDKSIPEVAKAMKEPVSTVMADLKEMCRRGYFNGYIDHRTQRMVFPHYQPPKKAEDSALTVIHCPGCGAVSAIANTGDPCKYCGAPLALEPPDDPGAEPAAPVS